MAQRRTIVLSLVCGLALPSAAFAHGGERQARSSFPLTTQHVNTHLTRDLGNGCSYEVSVSGVYRTRDPAGENLRTPIRDVDVSTLNQVSCRGRIVRRDTNHLIFPRLASAEDLLVLLHQRTNTRLPGPSDCAWAPVFDLNGGVLMAQSLVSSCSADRERAALMPFGGRPFRIGGGPRIINGRITNPYLENLAPLPHVPVAPPNPPLDYGTPRAEPGNTNK